MYLRSVKDVVPVRLGRIENPLPPEERFADETDYMNVSPVEAVAFVAKGVMVEYACL